MNKTRAALLITLLGLAVGIAPAGADLGFPDYVKLPPQIQVSPDQSLVKEDLGEVEIPIDKSGSVAIRRGVHFARWFVYKPAAGEPAPGYYNGTEERIFKAMLASFTKTGWQLVFANEGKSNFSLRLAKDGKDIWAAVKMDAPQAQVNLEVIEVGTASNKLALSPPGATPEKFGARDDFPWLPPYPGATRKDAGFSDGPLDVTVPGTTGEPLLVGSGVSIRSYQGPATLSKLQFIGEYREALIKAGWRVLYPADAKAVNDHASLVAHYTGNGRDLWVKLFYEFGASLSYSAVDVGAEDWAAKFAKDCRLPLYGVFFDFNKSGLRPESESVLGKAAALLKSVTGFNVEVQGHTDNVGGDDYNLKLSDARAAAVRAWFLQHGIETSRLASKGYGKTQPVADNNSNQGRARNRRVELVKLGCRKG